MTIAIVLGKQLVVEGSATDIKLLLTEVENNPNITIQELVDVANNLSLINSKDDEVAIIGARPITIRH